MELEPLFTDQRWKILQSLSSQKLSPLQLAQKTSTTISNISQQLKFLEAANIVKKEKVQNRDRGKPRTLFSLSKDHAYIVSVMNGFVEKKLFDVKSYRKAMVKIWFLGEEQLQQEVEEAYAELQPEADSLEAILLNTDKRELIITAKSLSKEMHGKFKKNKTLKIRVATAAEVSAYVEKAKADGEKLVVLFDKADILKNVSERDTAITQTV